MGEAGFPLFQKCRHAFLLVGTVEARVDHGALTFDAVYDLGIKDPNFVLGPKIPKANEYYSIIAAETQKCISGGSNAEETCKSIQTQLDTLHGV